MKPVNADLAFCTQRSCDALIKHHNGAPRIVSHCYC